MNYPFHKRLYIVFPKMINRNTFVSCITSKSLIGQIAERKKTLNPVYLSDQVIRYAQQNKK
jgi:hypothetical protein